MAKIIGKDTYLAKKSSSFRIDGCFLTYILILACLSFWVYVFSFHFPSRGAQIASAIVLVIFLIFYKRATNFLRLFRSYSKGLYGEEKVRGILQKLPETYTVFENVVIPPLTSNLDFVVVGPTGLFSVEVKSNSGRITEDSHQLLRNGYPFQEGDVLHQAYGESQRLSDYLLSKKIIFPEIQSLLVFSSRYASVHFGKMPVHGVLVIGASWLKEIIQNGAQSPLMADQIDKIQKVLQDVVA